MFDEGALADSCSTYHWKHSHAQIFCAFRLWFQQEAYDPLQLRLTADVRIWPWALWATGSLSNKAQGRQEGGNTRGAIGQWTGASIIQKPDIFYYCSSSSSSSRLLFLFFLIPLSVPRFSIFGAS
jgi:hypothetical protein